MGEELEFGQLFIKSDGSEYVPFEGFKPADIVICDELDMETYESLPKEGTIEFSISTCLDKRTMKTLKKWRRKVINQYRRRIRYEKRMKEYARRRKLKYGSTMGALQNRVQT